MAEKILIVDDEADTLRLVALMLERQGYEVLTAENGQEALAQVKADNPDLILLDVMMPDMDGFEVARLLRENANTKSIPIIMFTARTQVEDKITGLESGADVYLTKPTQPRELFAQVKAVLSRAKIAHPATAALSPADRAFTVGILAAKGGMGASALATNLGITMHRKTKKSVIVADIRTGFGGISLDLGHPNPEGLTRLLTSDPNDVTAHTIEMALISHPTGVQFLLASPQPNTAQLVEAQENYAALFNYLPHISKYLLLDLGPSLPPTTLKALGICSEVIVIVEPSPNNVHQTKALLRDLFELGIGEGRIHVTLVNRVRSSVQLNWAQVQDELGHKIAAIFTPAPELAYQASTNNQPMVIQQPNSITAQQFDKLASLITQQ